MSVDTESGVVTAETAVQIVETPVVMGPIMPIAEMARMLADLKTFVADQLVKDVDYGLIPGAERPSLYKPGAEKFTFLFGLGIEYDHVAGEVTANRVAHTYRCRLISLANGRVKAQAERSCNSDEENMQKAYLALHAKGYTDVRAIDNTVRGMAQKRALVASTLLATMASSFFVAREGGEDEKGELGVKNGDRPDWCSIHNQKMYRKQNEKGTWYSHKLPDGKWCNGPKKQDKPATSPAPVEASEEPPSPEGGESSPPTKRGDVLNWIEDRRKALQWTPAQITETVKGMFMRSSLTQCTDEELGKLASALAGQAVQEAQA